MISGPPAVGKTTVAKGLADVFNIKCVSGGDVLKTMATESGFESGGDDWWDTIHGIKFLEQRKQNFEYDKQLDQRLVHLFNKGDFVITSYTLPWLVQGGVKIWLEGSHASSARRMQSRDKMSSQDAYNTTKLRFDENKKLYKKLYNYDFGYDPDVFDLVINTNNLTAVQVINKAEEFVRKAL